MRGLTGSVSPGLNTPLCVQTYGKLPMCYVRKTLALSLFPFLLLCAALTAILFQVFAVLVSDVKIDA